nr:unnamed protein product [Callosobruchus analis]
MDQIAFLCLFITLIASSLKCVDSRTTQKPKSFRFNLDAASNEVATAPKGRLVCFSLLNSSFDDRVYIRDKDAGEVTI